ncbi:MAG: adenylate/guanylate cyclase domain-containing protein [Mycobacterium sp.]
MVCPSCGTHLRSDAKFCDECGTRLVGVGQTAEFKHATVLFADVVHSMDIASTVGPERLRELMSDVFDVCSDVVGRYGGTVDKFTGDGVMAVFGAPVALEDHAIRACMAALDIHRDGRRVSEEAESRDGVSLRLRIGLNSGKVIAGGVGSRSNTYTTVGDQVGMAQRMESVATPGGVVLSESTARLVAGATVLGERRLVRIKGADTEVGVYDLLSVTSRQERPLAVVSHLVGREWEMGALSALLDRAARGHGCVAGVSGPPGIGKSRMVAEVVAIAKQRGISVYRTFCESHTADVPFRVANRMLRAALGVDGLDGEAARVALLPLLSGADPSDVALLHDELGIRDPDSELPEISPDARRRRLAALVSSVVLGIGVPAVFVIEDAHWIDPTSEALIADFTSVIPQTKCLVLIAYRPEYDGALSRVPGAQTLALTRLDDTQTADMVGDLFGPDPSLAVLADRIVERVAGNPFFAEEVVRDLADRGAVSGERGAYRLAAAASDVEVPATVHAAIAARIDRLDPDAKRALNAAAVIGLRFDRTTLAALADGVAIERLIYAEFIEQVAFVPQVEYAFRHPLMRSVAYDSQLNAARAELHRRVAAVIAERHPESVEENAALIAEHLEAAGDLTDAFNWHMQAGNWSQFRDFDAARLSWERARAVADRMPAGPGRDAMRVTPRALLCASSWRVTAPIDYGVFDELRGLAESVNDKVSLALGIFGQILALSFAGRCHDACRLVPELEGTLEVVGEPRLSAALLCAPPTALLQVGDATAVKRLSSRIIDLTGGDPQFGDVLMESPFAVAAVLSATARMALGEPGWRTEFDEAHDLARRYLPVGWPMAMVWKYGYGVVAGALQPDENALTETAEMYEQADHRADGSALEAARFLYGFILNRAGGPDRRRGLDILAAASDSTWSHYLTWFRQIADIELAREAARAGELDPAITTLTAVLERDVVGESVLRSATVEALVEALLQRGAAADVDAAQAAIEGLAAMPTEPGFKLFEIPLLRLRALLASARGDAAGYRHHRDRYRTAAAAADFQGHIALAEAMP